MRRRKKYNTIPPRAIFHMLRVAGLYLPMLGLSLYGASQLLEQGIPNLEALTPLASKAVRSMATLPLTCFALNIFNLFGFLFETIIPHANIYQKPSVNCNNRGMIPQLLAKSLIFVYLVGAGLNQLAKPGTSTSQGLNTVGTFGFILLMLITLNNLNKYTRQTKCSLEYIVQPTATLAFLTYGASLFMQLFPMEGVIIKTISFSIIATNIAAAAAATVSATLLAGSDIFCATKRGNSEEAVSLNPSRRGGYQTNSQFEMGGLGYESRDESRDMQP